MERDVAEATNTVEASNCSHNHAEMNAIRLDGFDEGFKPQWKAEFANRGK